MPKEPKRREALGVRRVIVYLDANIIIYLVEKHPLWGPKALALIVQLQARGDQIAVGDASRLECPAKAPRRSFACWVAVFTDNPCTAGLV
jgi:hypothetical protein